MGGLITILPVLLSTIGPILGRIIPDQDKRDEIQAELTKALLDKDSALVQAMSAVMAADAAQDDIYTKRARPTVVYWSILLASCIAVAGFFNSAGPIISALQGIPDSLYNMMAVGIGAFGLSRGIEKGIRAIKK